MGVIHLLDSEISNKIAAGEVVERPASVIKELVENSIDAGATVITVEIKKGGSTYMRVADNGCGMNGEDAMVCFLRHATSKISVSEDLDAIYTLGFRGEALSSIGAVSKVSLYTKRECDENGVLVNCEGGEILSSEAAGAPNGTSVVVENLFYNTPARQKFLKKDSTEAGYITDIVSRFIFAHPEISFRLIKDGKEQLFSPGDNNMQNAIYAVYGRDYAKNIIPVEYEQDNIKLYGVIGKGSISRPNRNYQSFFVNRRYIKSPIITKALEEAYKNQVMIGKFPMAVINIEINPELIDINVHPTKLEVKFSDDQTIYRTVFYGTKNALYAIPNVPKIETAEKEEEKESAFKPEAHKEQLNLSDLVKDLPKNIHNKNSEKYKSAPHKNERKEYNARKEIENYGNDDGLDLIKKLEEVEVISKTPIRVEQPKISEEAAPEGTVKEKDEKAIEKPALPETEKETVFIDEYFKISGQIFDTYIIAEKGDEMLIIDQHAAHERLKYEELKASFEGRSTISQMLLEPAVIGLTGIEYAVYTENKDTLINLGFECEDFGENTILVRGVPSDVDGSEVDDLVLEIITQLESGKKELITEKNQRAMYTIACKAAVKANRRMSIPEMETLVRDVLRLKNINTCPHGRPIVITMSKKELEKEFKRIV